MTARAFVERVGRAMLRLLPGDAVVPVLGGPLKGLRWVVGAAPHGAWLGRLERDSLDDFASHATADAVVWDVGANVGLYTLAAARRGARVVAFEPARANVAALERHLRLNRLANAVEVVAAAVAHYDGIAHLAAGDSPSEFHLATAGDEIPCVSLDGWRRTREGPLPTAIKIDVEGAEAAVLDGGAETIRLARPRIYLAVHDGQHAACEARLRAWGYRLELAGGAPWTPHASEWIAVP